MAAVTLTGKLLKWGNSYGIRLRKSDVERAGLHEGADIVVRVDREPERIDLSHIHFLRGGRSDVSDRHDEELGRGRWEELQPGRQKSRRRSRR